MNEIQIKVEELLSACAYSKSQKKEAKEFARKAFINFTVQNETAMRIMQSCLLTCYQIRGITEEAFAVNNFVNDGELKSHTETFHLLNLNIARVVEAATPLLFIGELNPLNKYKDAAALAEQAKVAFEKAADKESHARMVHTKNVSLLELWKRKGNELFASYAASKEE